MKIGNRYVPTFNVPDSNISSMKNEPDYCKDQNRLKCVFFAFKKSYNTNDGCNEIKGKR